MTAPHEVELKLEVSARQLHELRRNAGMLGIKSSHPQTRELVSVYFDTGKLKLRKRNLSLRVRRDGDHQVQTIKYDRTASGTTFDRDEWEHEIKGDAPDLRAARGTALEPMLTKKLRRALKPVFETRIRRTVFPIIQGHTAIEMSLDLGQIRAGRRSAPLSEIELELKHGDAAELFKLARRLAAHAPVTLGVKSKAERGYELVAGEGSGAVKSAPILLSTEQNAGDAFRAVARACLHQLIANIPALRNRDPEGVHQARVSLRRMRAAISLFSAFLRDAQTQAIKAELKWLTAEFGPAREIDLFTKRLLDPLAKQDGDGGRAGKRLNGLQRELRGTKARAFKHARAVADSPRFRALVLDVASWIESGDWTRAADEAWKVLRERSIVAAATAQLDRRFKKILKRGRQLEELDPRKRHKLRIAVKKLRYAADFFATLFPDKKAEKRCKAFVGGLKGLQDCLGELNDITVNERFASRLAAAGGSKRASNIQCSRRFAAGRLHGYEEARTGAVMGSAKQAYRQFTRAKPFWK